MKTLVLRLTLGALFTAFCLPVVSWSQDEADPLAASSLIALLDHDDHHHRDDACAGLMALVRKQPDTEQKRSEAVELVRGIRTHFFETYKHLPKLMLEEESDNGQWITDSFEKVHAKQIPEDQSDYIEIAFEDVLCRIRGLRIEAIYGREEGMVAVDAGKFIAGSSREEVDEVAERVRRADGDHSAAYVESEYLDERVREARYPFYISREPVSVAEYQAFLADTGSPIAKEPAIRKNRVPGNPVCLGIDSPRALLYLYWAGKRLPSEDEWERAARGMYGRRYAPGNRTDTTMHLTPAEGGVTGWPAVADLKPVCEKPLDMAKRRFFTGPFGARSLGMFFEATHGMSRRLVSIDRVLVGEEAPHDLPPHRDDMYCDGGPAGWLLRRDVLRGGTLGLPSRECLYPRVAGRNQAVTESRAFGTEPYMFFRCALDIPEYGRRLHKEVTVVVKPSPGRERGWTNTGVEIRKGDGLVFRAKGAMNGPNGLRVGPLGKAVAPPEIRKLRIDDEFALVGMIGLDIVWGRFFVGRSFDTISHDNGQLSLQVNRSAGKGLTGAFTVTVRVYRK